MDHKAHFSTGSAVSHLARRLSHYISSIRQWNTEYFAELSQKRAAARQRVADKMTIFPRPDEIFDARCYFVLSTGRCGTGMLTKILQESPQLFVCHSPKPELEYVSSMIHQKAPSAEALELAVLAARFEILVEARQRGKVYVETNNRITFFASTLATLFPNSKFIHLVRCPADFVRSGMRRNYYKEGKIQHQRLCPIGNEEWSAMSQLEKIAWEWNEINSSIEDFKSTSNPERVMTIKSEDLFTKPETILKIYDFLDVTVPFRNADPQYLRKRLLDKPVNRQVSGDYPKYPNWTQCDKDALRTRATLAARYGYGLV